jgi:hypothetical protein
VTRALALVLLAACSGDDGTSGGCPTGGLFSVEQQQECRQTPSCQLLVRTCMTPAMCPDGAGPPQCATTIQPTSSSGPACDTLDEPACRMRDDCLQIRRVEDNGFMCHAE